jgi:pimeloyl-ACP methyl ester carboxylesterase
MLGATDPRIAFIVGMAPPAVAGIDVLVTQNEAILRSMEVDEETITDNIAYLEAVLPLARDGEIEAAAELSAEFFGRAWDEQDEDTQAFLGEREAYVAREVEARTDPEGPTSFTNDWFRSFLAYDPQPDWQAVTVPVLGLFGARDVQVVLEQNEPALRAALEVAGNEDVEIVVFPDGNHLFQASETGAIGEYGELAPEFTADFLPTLVAWVTEQAGVAG